MKFNPSLFALAAGAFGIGLTEFAPMGMLPTIATDLGISIPKAGLLVSAYALGVVIGAPAMILIFAGMERKRLLLLSMFIFTLGNLISAFAIDYNMLLVGRVLTAVNHGAFFGVGAVVAGKIVPVNKQAGAVAAMFSGLTIATIGGVPLAAWSADVVGWRTVFFVVSLIGLATMLALAMSLPSMPVRRDVGIKSEVSVLFKGQVLVTLLLTVVSSSAMFTVFTYIAPILQSEAHAGTGFVTTMLVLYGIGLSLGNWVGGLSADRSIDRTLIVSLIAVATLLVTFAFSMPFIYIVAPVIFLWGIASFALIPSLQLQVVEAASDAPNLASAMNIAGFNLGNAIGAIVGGAVISAGLGYPAVSLAGAVTAIIGVALALVIRSRRRAANITI